jgi:molybdate transport system permease protein
MNWEALGLSLQVTAVATTVILVVGLALGLLLARTNFKGKIFLDTLITLPLVLPPSVVGYFLLVSIGNSNPIIRWLDLQILFTWPSAVIASSIVGMPLMVQSTRAALLGVNTNLENAARTLGSTEIGVFFRVTLPLAKRGIIAGLILGAARALGEFGATLMVAGSIPGRTQTMPLAIYDAIQIREFDAVNQMVLVMTSLAFLALWIIRRFETRT